MRLVDADKIYTDCMTKDGKLAISQSQLANAPTVEINTNDIEHKAYCKGLEDGKKIASPQGEWIMEENNKDYPEGRATCSHCGYKMDVRRWEWLPAVRWYLKPNYCQECGADMRKPQTQKFADDDTAYGGLASAT